MGLCLSHLCICKSKKTNNEPLLTYDNMFKTKKVLPKKYLYKCYSDEEIHKHHENNLKRVFFKN